MATKISKYYKDELTDWNNATIFYRNEMNDLGLKLGEVIRRKSIVGIAQKVEAYQVLLNQATDKFYRLQAEIKQQDGSLKTDSTLIDDTSLDDEINNRQVDLRRKMHEAEKQYVDVKFACYNFLSETLQKKKE